jgi:ParB-like chromosome segregation protein Spo0J
MNVANSNLQTIPKQITTGDQTFTILFPDLLRPLTASEYAGLREDVKRRGIVVPIIIDEDYGVIDGIHRLLLAAELGITVPTDMRRDLSPEEKRELAVAVNEHRRQLSAEDRRELAKRSRANGKSIRAIAEQLGVDKNTILNDVSEIQTPETITGRDGKTYPATRPQTSPSAPAPDGTSATKPPVRVRSEKGMPEEIRRRAVALLKTLDGKQLDLLHKVVDAWLGGGSIAREITLGDNLREFRKLIAEKSKNEPKP